MCTLGVGGRPLGAARAGLCARRERERRGGTGGVPPAPTAAGGTVLIYYNNIPDKNDSQLKSFVVVLGKTHFQNEVCSKVC